MAWHVFLVSHTDVTKRLLVVHVVEHSLHKQVRLFVVETIWEFRVQEEDDAPAVDYVLFKLRFYQRVLFQTWQERHILKAA